MAEMPIEPCISRMLLAASELGCVEEVGTARLAVHSPPVQVLTIAAMLSVSNPYTARTGNSASPHEWVVKQGDHVSLLNLYNQFKVLSIGTPETGLTDWWRQERRRDRNWVQDNKVNTHAMKHATQIRQQLAAYMKVPSPPPPTGCSLAL